ncbi:unnamed protein product [Spirodela intermedia]|uniref:Uncharacterized protein n=1 Tax=Spirodela intermedia TaxID=51605 RepID=A0A7I8J1N1_SPIIN|nr:unnamed protein product [Spirodela intermedia]CAA6664125.1 unnamed protein product [Spirodela intermedia]
MPRECPKRGLLICKLAAKMFRAVGLRSPPTFCDLPSANKLLRSQGLSGCPADAGLLRQIRCLGLHASEVLDSEGNLLLSAVRRVRQAGEAWIVCTEEDSSWHLLPEEEPGLLTWLPDGQSVCLEANPDGTVSTGPCGGRAGRSESQWFQVEPKKSYVVAEVCAGEERMKQ